MSDFKVVSVLNPLVNFNSGVVGIGAGTNTTTAGTVIFGSSAGNVTFGMGTNGYVTGSAPSGGGGGAALSAGTQSVSTGTVAFANSNGISFGMSGSNQITASYTVPTQSYQPVAFSAANGSGTASTIQFANSNNVSFSTGTQGVYATASFPSQTVDTNKAGIGFTTTSTGGTALVGTLNTAGLSLGVPAWLTIAAGAGDGYNILGVNGAGTSLSATLQLSNSNNVSFGLNAGTITASASYPTQTAQPVAYSAANGSANFSTLTFANSNGVSFSTGTQGLYATVATNYQSQGAYLTTAAQSSLSNVSGVVAGTASNGGTATLSGNVSFSNANGISFYTSAGNAVVGTVKTDYQSSNANYLTSQNAQAVSGSNGSFTFQTVTFGSSNGMHFYTTNNSIVGSYTVPTIPGATVFSNSNNVSFGLNGSTVTATATFAQSSDPINLYAVGNTTQSSQGTGNVSALSFQGAGIASIGVTGNSVVISVPVGGGAGDGFNIVQLGTVGTTGTAWSSLSATVQLNGAGNVTVSQNNSNQLVVVGPAFGTSLNLTNLTGTLANNSNGIAISLQAGAAGGGAAISTYIPYYPASTGAQTLGAQGATSASAFFWPVSIQQSVSFNQIEVLMTNSNVSSATAAAGGQTVTQHFGIFTINGGSALSVLSSSSQSFCHTGNTGSATLSFPVSYGTAGGYTHTTTAGTGSAQIQSLWGTVGNRIATWGFGNTMSLSPGLYILGVHHRQSSSGFNIGNAFAIAGNVMAAAQNAGPLGSYTTAWTGTGVFKWPWGIHTSTGSANYGGSRLPDSVLISAISKTMTIMPMCTIVSR